MFRVHDDGFRRSDLVVVGGVAIVGCWLLVRLRWVFLIRFGWMREVMRLD